MGPTVNQSIVVHYFSLHLKNFQNFQIFVHILTMYELIFHESERFDLLV
jgi:hypothetical protein